MTSEQIDKMMEEIDATVDTSNYGILEGVGVVEVVSSTNSTVIVASADGTFEVPKDAVSPYDGR